jgi:hypothetical protein
MAVEYTAVYGVFPKQDQWSHEDVMECKARYTKIFRGPRIGIAFPGSVSLTTEVAPYLPWPKYPKTSSPPPLPR